MKRGFILAFLILTVSNIYCQDTVYFNGNWTKINSNIGAKYYKVLFVDKDNSEKVLEKNFNIDKTIISEIEFSSYSKGIRSGNVKFWHPNGTLKSECYVKNFKYLGVLKTFWANGQLKREDFYDNGIYKRGKCFDSIGNPIKHFDFDINAMFPGGNSNLSKYLSENLPHPQTSDNENNQKVVVKFRIDRLGNVRNAKITEGSNGGLDKEILRVINKMPQWIPATEDGEPIDIWYSIPIKF